MTTNRSYVVSKIPLFHIIQRLMGVSFLPVLYKYLPAIQATLSELLHRFWFWVQVWANRGQTEVDCITTKTLCRHRNKSILCLNNKIKAITKKTFSFYFVNSSMGTTFGDVASTYLISRAFLFQSFCTIICYFFKLQIFYQVTFCTFVWKFVAASVSLRIIL